MRKAAKNPKTASTTSLLPTLDVAVHEWRDARRNFLRRSGRESFERFHETTTMLFLAFTSDDAEKPWAVAAFESFRIALIAAEADERPTAAFHPLLLLR